MFKKAVIILIINILIVQSTVAQTVPGKQAVGSSIDTFASGFEQNPAWASVEDAWKSLTCLKFRITAVVPRPTGTLIYWQVWLPDVVLEVVPHPGQTFIPGTNQVVSEGLGAILGSVTGLGSMFLGGVGIQMAPSLAKGEPKYEKPDFYDVHIYRIPTWWLQLVVLSLFPSSTTVCPYLLTTWQPLVYFSELDAVGWRGTGDISAQGLFMSMFSPFICLVFGTIKNITDIPGSMDILKAGDTFTSAADFKAAINKFKEEGANQFKKINPFDKMFGLPFHVPDFCAGWWGPIYPTKGFVEETGGKVTASAELGFRAVKVASITSVDAWNRVAISRLWFTPDVEDDMMQMIYPRMTGCFKIGTAKPLMEFGKFSFREMYYYLYWHPITCITWIPWMSGGVVGKATKVVSGATGGLSPTTIGIIAIATATGIAIISHSKGGPTGDGVPVGTAEGTPPVNKGTGDVILSSVTIKDGKITYNFAVSPKEAGWPIKDPETGGIIAKCYINGKFFEYMRPGMHTRSLKNIFHNYQNWFLHMPAYGSTVTAHVTSIDGKKSSNGVTAKWTP